MAEKIFFFGVAEQHRWYFIIFIYLLYLLLNRYNPFTATNGAKYGDKWCELSVLLPRSVVTNRAALRAGFTVTNGASSATCLTGLSP